MELNKAACEAAVGAFADRIQFAPTTGDLMAALRLGLEAYEKEMMSVRVAPAPAPDAAPQEDAEPMKYWLRPDSMSQPDEYFGVTYLDEKWEQAEGPVHLSSSVWVENCSLNLGQEQPETVLTITREGVLIFGENVTPADAARSIEKAWIEMRAQSYDEGQHALNLLRHMRNKAVAKGYASAESAIDAAPMRIKGSEA